MCIQLVLGYLIALVSVAPAMGQTPLGTAFTYQGQLKENGVPKDGPVHLRFSMWDAAGSGAPPTGGSQVGTSQLLANVPVTNGLFNALLNAGGQFGANAFDGQERWLQVEVCADAGCGSLSILAPRQLLTGVPQALFALEAATASNVSQLNGQPAAFYRNATNINSGTLADARLSSNTALLNNAQTITGAKIFSLAPSFTASGSPIMVTSTSKVTNLNADLLDGLNSTAFLQSVPVPLSLSGTSASSHIILGQNASTAQSSTGILGVATGANGFTSGGRFECFSQAGTGVEGIAYTTTGTTVGVSGVSASTSGRGISGYASAASGNTNGVYGRSGSLDGIGVVGDATSTAASGSAVGVYGQSLSDFGTGVFGMASGTSGRGVIGEASAASGNTYGVLGTNNSTSGRGVFGWSFPASGTTYGVNGRSDSTNGRGVLGQTTTSTGYTYGVHGTTASNQGNGVVGQATAASGTTYGVVGESFSPSGRGVLGSAAAGSGVTYGVFGASASPSGFDFWAGGATTHKYGQNSSRRWKNNIEPIGQPLDKLARIRGVYFNWDAAHGGRHDLGMIAEEVGAVLPEIVGYEANGVDTIGMDYSKMTPLLVEAVNALRAEKDAEICEQRERIDALSIRLERLEKLMSQTSHVRESTD